MLKNRATLLAAVSIALMIIALFLWSITRPPTAPDFLANRTQGYERILDAVSQLPADSNAPNETNIAATVAKNQKAIEAYNRVASEKMEAPPRFYNASTMGTDFMLFKRFAHALLLKAKLAEQEQRWSDATELALETIRFGQNVERGPLINFLVGISIEGMAIKRLEQLLPNLPETNITKILPELSALNQSRIPFHEVVLRERYFAAKNTTNIFQTLQSAFSRKFRDQLSRSENRGRTAAAELEILATAMAARLYLSKQEKSLTTVRDLHPTYLPRIPIDPFSKAPLLITTNTGKLTIYSVGPNQQDDKAKSDDIRLQY
jgi:hypothetical protein